MELIDLENDLITTKINKINNNFINISNCFLFSNNPFKINTPNRLQLNFDGGFYFNNLGEMQEIISFNRNYLQQKTYYIQFDTNTFQIIDSEIDFLENNIPLAILETDSTRIINLKSFKIPLLIKKGNIPKILLSEIVGIPAGGNTDQSLIKNSNTDFDVSWQNVVINDVSIVKKFLENDFLKNDIFFEGLPTFNYSIPPLTAIKLETNLSFTTTSGGVGLSSAVTVTNPIDADNDVIVLDYTMSGLNSPPTAGNFHTATLLTISPNFTNQSLTLGGGGVTGSTLLNANNTKAIIYNKSSTSDAFIQIQVAKENVATASDIIIKKNSTFLVETIKQP